IDELVDVSERDASIPTYRVTKFQPMEISIVSVPFDQNAKIRNENNQLFTMELSSEESELMNEKEKLEQARLEERSRCEQIRSICTEYKCTKLADDYIRNGISVEQVKSNLEMFRKYQQQQ